MGSPSAIKNAKQLLVGGTPSTNTITTGNLDSAAFQASTNVGEIGVFSVNGVRLTEATAATTDRFVIAVSRGAAKPPLVSDVIDKSTITVCNLKEYDAATEQIDFIGYNGTSGAIEDLATYAGDLYVLNLIFQQFMSGTDAERIKKATYQSSINDDQSDVAIGLAQSFERNFSREVKNAAGVPPIVANTICNNAGAASTAASGTITFTKGSRLVATSGATPATDYPVGSFIRFGTAVTAFVYKVVGVSNADQSITLDRPYQGVDGTLTVTNHEFITAALGAAADWGLRINANVLDFNRVKSKYSKVRFELIPNESFGSTPVTKSVRAYEGSGTFQQVAGQEDFLNSFTGEQYRMGEPYLFDYPSDWLATAAVAGGGYDLISINHSNVQTLFSNEVSLKELVLAIPATVPNYADTANAADDLSDVLEVLAGLGTTALTMA